MNKFLIGLFLFPCLAYGQSIVFTGKVFSTGANPQRKIYYTEQGKKFSKSKYITFDKNDNYVFNLKYSDINKDSVKVLVFSEDLDKSSDNEKACVHRFYISNILKTIEHNASTNISLESDLLFSHNCLFADFSASSFAGNEVLKFVGAYEMKINEIVHTIDLIDLEARYLSVLTKNNINSFDQEYGTWEYNFDKKILTFTIEVIINSDYGLMKKCSKKYAFNVFDDSNITKFEPLDFQGFLVKK